MKLHQVFNMEEFAARHQLSDTFGAYAAHFSINEEARSISINPRKNNNLADMMKERTLFTKLILVKEGHLVLTMEDPSDLDSTANSLRLSAHDMLIVSFQKQVNITNISKDFEAECILVDEFIANDAMFHLSKDRTQSILDIFHIIRDIVRHQHIYKVEMIQSMFNVLRLSIAEMPYEGCSVTSDLKHKKEVYEIFLHHLYRNFRSERQIRFYANKLHISTTYLSRLVKEISGSTVNDHVSSLIYKEICNLLKQKDMTMGEIADLLNFSDQSAMSNFFKQRAGISPLAYRNK